MHTSSFQMLVLYSQMPVYFKPKEKTKNVQIPPRQPALPLTQSSHNSSLDAVLKACIDKMKTVSLLSEGVRVVAPYPKDVETDSSKTKHGHKREQDLSRNMKHKSPFKNNCNLPGRPEDTLTAYHRDG